jgi:hypothetical protein
LFDRSSICSPNPLLPAHFDGGAGGRIVSTGESEFSVTTAPRVERVQKYFCEIYVLTKD